MVGEVVARYRITELLGKGGMGDVYRATDVQLGREVALKILPRQWCTDPERVRRFQAEARAASSLSHPNVAAIYDAGVSGDTPYIAMELVRGRRLRDLLHGDPLPNAQLLRIGAQIATGLDRAHNGRNRPSRPEARESDVV